MIKNNSYNPFSKESTETLLLEKEENQIVLFNDDINTFDDVIHWLVEICDHNPLQAEQCAIIVHYKGKCIIKKGTYEDLLPKASALMDRGLTVEII